MIHGNWPRGGKKRDEMCREFKRLIHAYPSAVLTPESLDAWYKRAWEAGATHDDSAKTRLDQAAEMLGDLHALYDLEIK